MGMQVPFKVIFEYCRCNLSQEGYNSTEFPAIFASNQDCDKAKRLEYDKIGHQTIKNYIGGHRTGIKTFVAPKKDSFNKIFNKMWKEYFRMTPENYKENANAFFEHLRQTKNIDDDCRVRQWIESIENEHVNQNNFENFMYTCTFYYALWEYTQLWNDEEYRNFDPDDIRTLKGKGMYHLASPDDYADYMPQSLTDTESGEPVLTLDYSEKKNDFSFFKNNRLSLITGPGGQGKTCFLNMLHRIHSDFGSVFDNVFIVHLAELTGYDRISASSNGNWIQDIIYKDYSKDIFAPSNETSLILLDGFNEYRASKNKDVVGAITKSIEELIRIVKYEKKGLSVVITAREAKKVTSVLTNVNDMKILSLSGTDSKIAENIVEKCENKLSLEVSELRRLADIPLYALLLKDLPNQKIEEIRNKYSLLDWIYTQRSRQRLRNEKHIAFHNKSIYLFYYYVALPYTAYSIVMSEDISNAYSFGQKEVEAITKGLEKDNLGMVLHNYFCKGDYIDHTYPEITANDLRMLLENDEEKFITSDYSEDPRYSFAHEEWRDYLVARYLHTVAEFLKLHHTDKDYSDIMSMQLSFNVDEDISQMVLQSFGFDRSKENNEEAAIKYFTLDTKNNDSEYFKNYIVGIICFLHIAFDLNEYTRWQVPKGENEENETLSKIFQALYAYLLESKFIDHLNNPASNLNKKLREEDKNRIVLYVCEILSKVAEESRRNNQFKRDLNAVNLAKKLDNDSDIILQQEAKLYLSVLESRILKRHIDKEEIPQSIRTMDDSKVFETGMNLLSKLARRGFHLSGNTSGLIKSFPAPVLVRYMGKKLKTDFCGAFEDYMGIIYSAGYVRRDIAYTVRQALSLLLKGYIRISEENDFDPENDISELDDLKTEICTPLFATELNEETLDFASKLIKKAEGQKLDGLNYLRGLLKYYRGEKEAAHAFFTPDKSKGAALLSDIQLKYRYGEDVGNRIEQGFDDLIKGDGFSIKKIGDGQYDKFNPVYMYIEARETELSLCKGDALEKRRQEFKNLEEREEIFDTVNMIYSRMISKPEDKE